MNFKSHCPLADVIHQLEAGGAAVQERWGALASGELSMGSEEYALRRKLYEHALGGGLLASPAAGPPPASPRVPGDMPQRIHDYRLVHNSISRSSSTSQIPRYVPEKTRFRS